MTMTCSRKLCLLVSACATVMALAMPAKAQQFPQKPVEMTVLFGGSAKSIAHVLADLMSKELGQPVAAVSRTGGGGAVGYTYVQGTKPDGYNVVWNSNSISTSHHKGNMPFNYSAFDAVARVSLEVPVMAVRADRGWTRLADFQAAAKGQKMKVGISGKGSFTHLTSAALFQKMGIQVQYVPYGKGKAPAELLAGRIDAALQWPSQFKSHADAGTLEILAVTSAERIPLLASVPTAMEQGFDIDITMWRGLAVPRGTPRDRVLKLQDAAKRVIEGDAFQDAGKKLGFEPAYLSAEDFDALIARDDERIAKLMSELGLKK